MPMAEYSRPLSCEMRTPFRRSLGFFRLTTVRKRVIVVQYVAALIVAPRRIMSKCKTLLLSQNTIGITMQTDCTILNFFDRGEPVCSPSMLAHLVSGYSDETCIVICGSALMNFLTIDRLPSKT
jgi:hypothetical protein